MIPELINGLPYTGKWQFLAGEDELVQSGAQTISRKRGTPRRKDASPHP